MTKIKIIPRKIFVLQIAILSRAFEIFIANSCIRMKMVTVNAKKNSNEKIPIADVIMKNHRVKPVETAKALKRLDESSILDWINEGE